MSATKKGHSHDKVVTPFSDMEIATPNHPEWNRMKFPHRLFHLLNFMENEGLAHMAHWDGQGVCFRIRKSEELVNKVLPFFFQQRKWKSLQRVRLHFFKTR